MNTLQELIVRAVKENQHAAEFLVTITTVCFLWDDLVDQDKAISVEQINTSFWGALIVLPCNLFYQQYFVRLQPLVAAAILNWRTATQMEREKVEKDLHIAFVLRSSYVDLIVQCALIIGGMDWAIETGIELRRAVHGEGYDQYVLDLQTEYEARRLK